MSPIRRFTARHARFGKQEQEFSKISVPVFVPQNSLGNGNSGMPSYDPLTSSFVYSN